MPAAREPNRTIARIKGSAVKELERIPKREWLRIIAAIDLLGEQPLAGAPLKGALRGLRRHRVGNYRIVCELLEAELVVLVVRAAHRNSAYHRP